MKTKQWFTILVAILLLLPLAALAAPVGKITAVQGNVDITVKGAAARNVNIGDAVNVGDFVRTKSKSKAEITFNEGNLLRLGENSRLGITEYMSGPQKNSSILNLFRGRIQNIVKSVRSGGRYEVHTPTSVCGVRGTHFFNFYLAGASGSIFQEGSGYGYSKGKPEDVKTITAGQGMFVVSGAIGAQLRAVSDKQLDEMKNSTEITGSSGGDTGDTGSSGGAGGTGNLAGDPPPPPPPPPPTTTVMSPPIVVPPIVVPPNQPAVIPLSLSITPANGFTHRIDEGGTITGTTTDDSIYSLKADGGMTGTADNPAAGLVNGTITSGTGVTSGLSGYMMGLPNAARTGAKALISTIYVNNDGQAGFMVGPLALTFSTGTFSGTGIAYQYTPIAATPYTPATLSPIVFGSSVPGPGNIAIYPDAIYLGCSGANCESQSKGIVLPDGNVMGVWGSYSQGGSYSNSTGITNFTRRFFGYDPTNKVIHYSENLTGAVDTTAREVSASADFTYMNRLYIGATTMNHFGYYDASNIYTSISSGTLQLVPLAFANVLEAPPQAFGINGLMGSTGDIWANASVPIFTLGKYIPYNDIYNRYSTTMYSTNYRTGSGNLTNDGKGAYGGFFNSMLLLSSTNMIHTDYQYLYADTSGNIGILRGTSSGPVYASELGFKAYGALNRIQMEKDTGIDANTFVAEITSSTYSGSGSPNLLFALGGGPDVSLNFSNSQILNVAGKKTWGIGMKSLSGLYNNDPRGDVAYSYDLSQDQATIGSESAIATIQTSGWAAASGGYFRSNVAAASAIWDSAIWDSAATWISGGTIMGTFSSLNELGTWSGVYLGTQIETTVFMALASDASGRAQLAALNIPAYQVGSVTLSGNSGPWTSLNINNTGFYASTSGGKPQIWASNNVSGNFNSNTNITSPVTLSGSTGNNTFSASFAIQSWNTETGKWGATVTSGLISPGLNGATGFRGAAAGTGATSSSGTIAGTASGITH